VEGPPTLLGTGRLVDLEWCFLETMLMNESADRLFKTLGLRGDALRRVLGGDVKRAA